MNIILIILGTLLHILTNATLSLRSRVVYKRLKYDVKLKTLSEIFIIVAAANVIAPFRLGGVLVRTYILKKIKAIPHKMNIIATAIEQIVDVSVQIIVVLICIYLIGIGTNIDLTSKIIISSIALVGLLVLFFWTGMKDLTYKTLIITERIIPRKIMELIKKKTKIKKDHFIEILNIIQTGKNRIRFLLLVVLTTLFIYVVFPIPLYFFAEGFDIKLTLTQIFVVFWLPMFLGRVSGIPAGLGIREASMIYILTIMGVDTISATSLTLTFRTLTIIGVVISGILLSAKYGLNILKIKKNSSELLKKEERENI